MKIDNLDAYPSGSHFEADVVIVGGGPAGLTIAREFMNSATTVLVLESGLEKDSVLHMELNRLESRNEPNDEASRTFRDAFHRKNMPIFDQEVQPYGVRCRVLGGSAAYWGGKSAIFDELDFKRRSWVPNSGWPFSRETLAPYIDRAAKLLNLGPNLYDAGLWNLIGSRIKRLPLDPSKLRSFFWQFARSRLIPESVMNFADEFRAVHADNIRTLVNATVLHIDTNDAGNAFSSLEVSTIAGARSRVTAEICILAAGAIENARLLLNSDRQHKGGLGNAHDNVGRYLMDHPGSRIGYFKKGDLKAAKYLGFYAVPHDGEYIMYMHGLVFSPEFQAKNNLLNAAIYVLPEISPKDPIGAAKRLLKFRSASVLADLSSLMSGSGLLVRAIALKIFYSGILPRSLKKFVVNCLMYINPDYVVREFLSKRVPHQLDRMGIHVITEQRPDRENRVMLSEQKDALGTRRVIASWKISEAERRTVIALGQLLQAELPKAGMPVPVLDRWIVENRPEEAVLVDMAHILGTTRMSEDPTTGVVDTTSKVHGIDKLYIAGSSVFPTSSHVNPTLMIVGLAIRLADHIKEHVFPILTACPQNPVNGRGNYKTEAFGSYMIDDTEKTATVLVLGAAGFIGRELVQQLLDSGFHVRAMVRGATSVLDQLPTERLVIVRGDLTNKADLANAISGADFVFHLANAQAKTWDEQLSRNVEPTRLVGELCVVNRVKRLVYAGTIDSYYAGSRAGVITEKTQLDPSITRRNYYARAKAAAERILVEIQKTHQLPLIIARPGIVIGAGGNPFHGAVGRFSDHRCEVWGNGKNKLPLVLVSDVASALVKMITTVGIEGDAYNLIDRPLLTAPDYLAELQSSTGQKLDITYRQIWRLYLTDFLKWTIKMAVRHPDRLRIPSYFDWKSRTQKAEFNCDHARNVLGWQPASDRQRIVDEGIRDAVRSWRAATNK